MNTVEAALLQARRQTLPPFDEHATEACKVFDPKQMAETMAWGQVCRIVDKVIKSTQESGNTSDWISNLLGTGKPKAYIPESINDLLQPLDPFNKKSHIFRARSAFFLYLMLRFHHKIATRKRIVGDQTECVNKTGVPTEVGNRLLELFTIPIEAGGENGFMSTNRHMDKLHSYILVLYIIASGDMKASTINQLIKDIKMDEKKAMLIYREAGFTVKKSGKGDIGVSLSVPLTFPPPKRGKRT